MIPEARFGHPGRWWRKYSRREGLWAKNESCFGVSLGGCILGNLQFVVGFFFFLKRNVFLFFSMWH